MHCNNSTGTDRRKLSSNERNYEIQYDTSTSTKPFTKIDTHSVAANPKSVTNATEENSSTEVKWEQEREEQDLSGPAIHQHFASW